MGRYMWKSDMTIELLNAVSRWEIEMKETQPKGRGTAKWHWIATQLFVPDEASDLPKLSKRCKRRVELLKTNYETYCKELELAEQSTIRSPPLPMRVDPEVWKKMKDCFGAPRIPNAKLIARAPAGTHKTTCKKVEDDPSSENEGGAVDHDAEEDNSSSSVGSNHSYHASGLVSSPTTSSQSSYFDVSSSDGYSDIFAQTTKMTACRTLNNQALLSGHDSSADLSLHRKTVSHIETSTSSWESNSNDSGQMPGADKTTASQTNFKSQIGSIYPAAFPAEGHDSSADISLPRKIDSHIETSTSSWESNSNNSDQMPGADKTSVSQANFTSQIEDLKSVSPNLSAIVPSATAASGSVNPAAFPADESNHTSSQSSSASSESKGCSACCRSANCCNTCSSFGISTPGNKAAEEYVGPVAGRLSENGKKSSSNAPREVIVYNGDINASHHIKQLPASLSSLNLTQLPSREDDDHEECEDECSKASSSSNRNSKIDKKRGSRGTSSPSSKFSSSDAEHSSSTSFVRTNAKHDVNLMVHIKLHNLKLSET